ncbi:acyltransferase family protein [Pantoea allii]|uniref:acyltransferase family protein n=1 Tax=Pantoea allii TaxID=574096 RepID=UPI003D7BCF00
MNNTHIQSADSIRGIACMVVVMSHLALTFFPALHGVPDLARNHQGEVVQKLIFNSPFSFWYSGSSAVYVFFMLSGIVLSKSYSDSGFGLSVLHRNILKRYVRLMLPSLFSTIMVFAVVKMWPDNNKGSSFWFERFGGGVIDFYGALKEGAIGVFSVGYDIHYNWVLWTMSIEFIGSLVLMAIYTIPVKYRFNAKVLMSFVMILLSFTSSSLSLTLGILLFLCGSIFYEIRATIKPTIITMFLLAGLYLAGYHSGSSSYRFLSGAFGGIYSGKIGDFSYASSGFLICISLISASFKILNRDSGLLKTMGKLSFSLYLIHLTVVYTFGMFAMDLLNGLGFRYSLSSMISIIFIVLISIPLAYIFYKFIDRLSIKASRFIL